MVLPIYTYGQPVLRKVAEDIDKDYPELEQLIQNMYDTLERSEGIGLAAPQVGLDIRLVVINLDVISDDLPEYKGYVRTFINPYIEEVDDSEINDYYKEKLTEYQYRVMPVLDSQVIYEIAETVKSIKKENDKKYMNQ